MIANRFVDFTSSCLAINVMHSDSIWLFQAYEIDGDKIDAGN